MDISPESDPKSQDEIPVLSSYGKNFECYVSPRALFEENFCGWRIYRAAIQSEKDTYNYMVSGSVASSREKLQAKLLWPR